MIYEEGRRNVERFNHPWRRFFARMFDVSMYTFIWDVFIGLLRHKSILSDSLGFRIVEGIVSLILILLVEPVLLNRFKTTVGKAIFGIRIETEDGKGLPYKVALERTKGVIISGLGLNIPFYNLYRLYKSVKACEERSLLPWEEEENYRFMDTKKWRIALYIGAYSVLFAIIFCIHQYQFFPPNRGELTMAEFVENYRYYETYLEMDESLYRMNDDGQIVKAKEPEGTFVVNIGGDWVQPDISYIMQEDAIKEVIMTVEVVNQKMLVDTYHRERLLLLLAMAGSDSSQHIWSNNIRDIVDDLNSHLLESYAEKYKAIKFSWEIETEGLDKVSDGYHWLADEDENAMHMEFRVSKVDS